MQRLWSADELLARWSLMPADMELLAGFTGVGKLGLAAQLAFGVSMGASPMMKPIWRRRWWRTSLGRLVAERILSTGMTGRAAPVAGTVG